MHEMLHIAHQWIGLDVMRSKKMYDLRRSFKQLVFDIFIVAFSTSRQQMVLKMSHPSQTIQNDALI